MEKWVQQFRFLILIVFKVAFTPFFSCFYMFLVVFGLVLMTFSLGYITMVGF